MSRSRQLLGLLALALLATCPSLSRADDADGNWSAVSFGPRATYFKPKDGDGVWSGGAQLRIRPWRFLGFEGSVDYRREKFESTRVDVYPVQASVLAYILPMRSVDIFLLGGGGWYYTHVDRPSPADDETKHRFGAHAGAGVDIYLSRAWSIDGTYRYIWLEKFNSTDDSNLLDKELDDRGSQVTIGLNYHF